MISFFKSEKEELYVEKITDAKCHLKKNVIKCVNSAIGVLGPPGAGKSTLCCAYYKTKYGMDNQYFEMSDQSTSFTKGIWILKESQRMKIKDNIDRDILDCEGFQVDKIDTWKYVLLISFLCSEIIILNRNSRAEEVKKILNIIKNSLTKMREANIPKLLKNIYIQMPYKKHFDKFSQFLTGLGYNPDSIESVKINPIFIPGISPDNIDDDNVLAVEEYMQAVKTIFEKLPCSTNQSISNFVKYIDNLNKAIDGKMNFDAQGIINDLKNEYKACYETWYEKKKNELLTKELSGIDNLNETFDDFIDKQNLDFSFDENLNELTFYGSSEEFDKFYEEFKNDYDFKVDKSIFMYKYESERNQKQNEEYQKGTELEKEKSKIGFYFQKQKTKIDKYFGNLKFYDFIGNKSELCVFDIDTKLEDEKKKYSIKLEQYYESRKKDKKNNWENQIKRAKYKSVCQAQGELKCLNGHKLNSDPIKCGGKCDGTLYWVDGPTHYSICAKCDKISKLESIICLGCKAKAYCIPKFTDYIP